MTSPPTSGTGRSPPTVVSTAIVSRLSRRPGGSRAGRRSRRPTDMTGNAAIANEAPIRLTGTLWKFRAKLTELTLPGVEAARRAR